MSYSVALHEPANKFHSRIDQLSPCASFNAEGQCQREIPFLIDTHNSFAPETILLRNDLIFKTRPSEDENGIK